MWSPETIFRRSVRLKQTDRTCWMIQTHLDEPNWARRQIFYELNSLSLVRLMKSSTFRLGLIALPMHDITENHNPEKITPILGLDISF